MKASTKMVLDGRQVEYWPNGKLKEECFQKYDYYVGSFKLWNEQGILISHQEFDEKWKFEKAHRITLKHSGSVKQVDVLFNQYINNLP